MPSNEPIQHATMLYESPWVSLGLWDCPPDSPRWNQENTIGDEPVIAIPWTNVVIDRASARNALVNQNSTVFYAPGDNYNRKLASDRGDRCAFINPSPQLLREALLDAGLDNDNTAFPFEIGPAVSWVTGAHHALAHALTTHSATPDIVIEEILTSIVRKTTLAAARHDSRIKPSKPVGTNKAHRELTHLAIEIMADSIANTANTQRLKITDIAKRAHASAYHLCRVFKSHTGESLAQHLMRLRLRAAAEMLVWSDDSITTIAHRLGFANHAHFTTAWKSEFGRPPSSFRSKNALAGLAYPI
jgi:AraC-like DNA-binding protein